MSLNNQPDFYVPTTAGSMKVAASTTLASTAAIGAVHSNRVRLRVVCDAGVFMRQGTTVLANGTDQYLSPNWPVIVSVDAGQKISFITATGTANVYLTPLF